MNWRLSCGLWLPLILAFLPSPVMASASALSGVSCTVAGANNVSGPDSTGNNFICDSGTITWKYPGYQFGALASTTTGCSGTNAGQVQYNGGAFYGCLGSNPWTQLAPSIYDYAIFMPTTPGASVVVRVASTRNATFPVNLTGSSCVAKAGATSSTTITINQIRAGVTTARGTIVFAAGGRAQVDTTGPQHLQAMVRTSATDYTSSNLSPPQGTWGFISNDWPTNPNTGVAWTTSDLTAAGFNIGFKSQN